VRSHLLHLLVYSMIVAAFFGLLSRRTPRERLRLAAIIWASMVGGTLVLAYLMYALPL
jgi:hypothetical protein